MPVVKPLTRQSFGWHLWFTKTQGQSGGNHVAATDENNPAPQIPSRAGLAEPEPAAAVLTTESATAAAMQCATDMLPAFERKLSFLETGGGSASVENDEDAKKSSGDNAAGYRLVSM